MTIQELQKVYQSEAAKLGDYQSISKLDLANGYCDAEAMEFAASDRGDIATAKRYNGIKSQYIAALMLRYWYKIFEWMNNSSSLLVEPEEFVDWLYHGFWVAFYYKAWRDEYKAKYKFGKFQEWVLDKDGERIPNPYYYVNDPAAPDKIFHRCIFSVRGKEYQFANKQKRKDGVHKLSLDAMIAEDGDFAAAASNAFVIEEPVSPVSELIRNFVKRGEIVEAFIVDGIAHADSFKADKSSEVKTASVFDPRKLVKHLNNIDVAYIEEFSRMYGCKKDLLLDTDDVTMFQKMNNSKLYKAIEKTICEIKQTPDLLGCLI